MAAFPSSDKTFTTKVDGADYPQASHINDLQGEVSAVELFLLSATPSGTMWNGKLSVSSSSDFLTYSLLNNAGNVPSSTDPVFININGTIRQVTAQAGFTINPATNWFNSGSAELGTLAVPYFVYAVWDSNSSAVSLTIARKPHYRIVAAAMATTTSENHIYNYSNYTVGDDVANIGYFEAILSLSGTGHLWSVPTFTGDNLRHQPTYESQIMSYTPTHTSAGGAYTNAPTNAFARYAIKNENLWYEIDFDYNATSGGSGASIVSLPFTAQDGAISAINRNTKAILGVLATGNDIFIYDYAGNTPITNGQGVNASGLLRIS